MTTIPFTTATLAGVLADGSAAHIRVAAVLYGGASSGFAIAFTLLYARILLTQLRARSASPTSSTRPG